MNINAAYDSQSYVWPFNNNDRVVLNAEYNGHAKGLIGKVDLSKPAYFWVIWDDNTYSSFSKLQMKYLNAAS